MTIQIGDRIPLVTLKTMTDEGSRDITTDQIFDNKKVVMFAVPGAFTPGCSLTHLPGFVANADKIKAKGVDTIACMAVNDVFVMDAWGKAQQAEAILMLADGNASFTRALGLELDASGFGLGTRSQRFAMIVDNGIVTALNLEPTPGIKNSSAEEMLKLL